MNLRLLLILCLSTASLSAQEAPPRTTWTWPGAGLDWTTPASVRLAEPEGGRVLELEGPGFSFWVQAHAPRAGRIVDGLEAVAKEREEKDLPVQSRSWTPNGATRGLLIAIPEGEGAEIAAVAMRDDASGHLFGGRADSPEGRAQLDALLDTLVLVGPRDRLAPSGLDGVSLPCPDDWLALRPELTRWVLRPTDGSASRIEVEVVFPEPAPTAKWARHLEDLAKNRGAAAGDTLGPDEEVSEENLLVLRDENGRLAFAITGTARVQARLEAGPDPDRGAEGLAILSGLRSGGDPLEGGRQARFDAARRGPPVRFTLPRNWKLEKPSSSMRLAEVVIPGEQDLTAIVYWFGPGGGGDVQANLDRWEGQFAEVAHKDVQRKDLGEGVQLVTLDVHGRYAAETTPGSGERVDEPDTRMLAAILDVPRGPLFIKLTGPKSRVDAEAHRVIAWLESFRATP